MTASRQPPRVVDLGARREYRPDVVSVVCSKVAHARERAGLPVTGFAAALEPLLGWLPTPDLVRTWESAIAPPGQVIIAADVVASRIRPAAPPMDVGYQAATSEQDHSPTSGSTAADAAAMQAFRNTDLRAGGAYVYAPVLEYLKTQEAPRLLLAAPDNDDERIIFTSATAVSVMGGWMAHAAGRETVARRHFTRALALVAVGGDRHVTAHLERYSIPPRASD